MSDTPKIYVIQLEPGIWTVITSGDCLDGSAENYHRRIMNSRRLKSSEYIVIFVIHANQEHPRIQVDHMSIGEPNSSLISSKLTDRVITIIQGIGKNDRVTLLKDNEFLESVIPEEVINMFRNVLNSVLSQRVSFSFGTFLFTKN